MFEEEAPIALVTGASAGLGRAISCHLAESGWRVIAAARRVDRLAELQGKAPDHCIWPLSVDLSDPVSIDAAISSIPPEWRPISALVNNAGLALGMEPAQGASSADWGQMIDTNCKGLALITRAVLPEMVERRAGHVVNLGSVAGSYPYPGGNVYGATKAFVHQFSLNLRSDLHGTGVRVSCIEPGMCVGTEFSKVRFRGDADRARSIYEGFEALTPEDIAAAVCWTLSQPAHVNVNSIELMPVAQSFSAFQIARS